VIHELTRADYSDLARFNSTFPGDGRDRAVWSRRFIHWWDTNPTFAEPTPRGWIIRAPGGDAPIVGFLGNIPLAFQLNGTEVVSFAATTWRVLPEFRAWSMQLYAAHIAAGQKSVLFNTTPSGTVERVLAHFHYNSLPTYAQSAIYLIPLRPHRVATAWLSGRRTKSLSWVAAAALSVSTAASRALLRSGTARAAEAVDHAGEEFDDLWIRTKDRFTNTAVRDRARLQWWCFGNPDLPKRLFAHRVGGRLAGYAVFRDSDWRGCKVLELLDLWGANIGDSYTPLLRAAVAAARTEGIELIALPDFHPDMSGPRRRNAIALRTSSARRSFYHVPLSREGGPFGADDSLLSGMDGDFAL
jgi:hypothetical protein